MRPLLATFDRQTGILIALATLAVASAIVSWGAWVLLRRERRAARSGTATPGATGGWDTSASRPADASSRRPE